MWFQKSTHRYSDFEGETTVPGPAPAPPPAPPDPELTFKFIFSLTHPGMASPLSELPPPLSGRETEWLSELVMQHFRDGGDCDLPLPSLAAAVMALQLRGDTGTAGLVSAIERHEGASSRVLRAANAGTVRRATELLNLRSAISVMGWRQVANLAIGVSCCELYDRFAQRMPRRPQLPWRELFVDAATVAWTATDFARRRELDRADDLFLAGIFHDVGKAFALRSLGRLVHDGRIPPLDAREIEPVVEQVHVALGVEAHRHWSLPAELQTICDRHHDVEVPNTPEHAPLHVLRVVSGLNALRAGGRFNRALVAQVRQSARVLRITMEEMRTLFADVRSNSERVGSMFLAASASTWP